MSNNDFALALQVLNDRLDHSTDVRANALLQQEMLRRQQDMWHEQQVDAEKEIASVIKAINILRAAVTSKETAAEALAAADSLRSL
jgi:hypothetical protein